MRAVNSKKGDTLVEVMVALALFLIVSVGIASSQTSILSSDRKSEERIHFSSVLKEISSYYQTYGNNVYDEYGKLMSNKIDWADKYFGVNKYYKSKGSFYAYYDEYYNLVNNKSSDIDYCLKFDIIDSFLTINIYEYKDDVQGKYIYENVEFGYNNSDSNYVICYELIGDSINQIIDSSYYDFFNYFQINNQYLMYKYYYFLNNEIVDYSLLTISEKENVDIFKVFYEFVDCKLTVHVFSCEDGFDKYIYSINYGYPKELLKKQIIKEMVLLFPYYSNDTFEESDFNSDFLKADKGTYHLEKIENNYVLTDTNNNIIFSINNSLENQTYYVDQLGYVSSDKKFLEISLYKKEGSYYLYFNNEDEYNVTDISNTIIISGTETTIFEDSLYTIFLNEIKLINNSNQYIVFNYAKYYDINRVLVIDENEAAFKIDVSCINGNIVVSLLKKVDSSYVSLISKVLNVSLNQIKYSLYQDLIKSYLEYKDNRVIEKNNDSSVVDKEFNIDDFNLWRQLYFSNDPLTSETNLKYKKNNDIYTYCFDDIFFDIETYLSENDLLVLPKDCFEVSVSYTNNTLKIDLLDGLYYMYAEDVKDIINQTHKSDINYPDTDGYAVNNIGDGYFVEYELKDGELSIDIFKNIEANKLVSIDDTTFTISYTSDASDNIVGFVINKPNDIIDYYSCSFNGE